MARPEFGQSQPPTADQQRPQVNTARRTLREKALAWTQRSGLGLATIVAAGSLAACPALSDKQPSLAPTHPGIGSSQGVDKHPTSQSPDPVGAAEAPPPVQNEVPLSPSANH